MPTGQSMLDLAKKHIGEAYKNVLVPKNNPNWHGPWDCAELLSWLVYQVSQQLYGCIDDHAPPAVADAYTGGWQSDSARLGIRVSVQAAAATIGGILLRFPPAPGTMGHIVICDGLGGTVEAKGEQFGVVADTVQGRFWDTGVLMPGYTYAPPNPNFVYIAPTMLYALHAPNMLPSKVIEIQQALAREGFDPGPIDGIFGLNTAAATAAFQRVQGLVVDGQVGIQTANALGVALP